jgi:hypothetical protein
MSEYFLLVYTLMRSIIGHVSINNTSAVLMYYLMNNRMPPLGILGIFIETSPMSVSAHFMPAVGLLAPSQTYCTIKEEEVCRL